MIIGVEHELMCLSETKLLGYPMKGAIILTINSTVALLKISTPPKA